MPKLPLKNQAYLMAERMGFEPMKELLLYTLSKRAPSTTRPPLPEFYLKNLESLNAFNRNTKYVKLDLNLNIFLIL